MCVFFCTWLGVFHQAVHHFPERRDAFIYRQAFCRHQVTLGFIRAVSVQRLGPVVVVLKKLRVSVRVNSTAHCTLHAEHCTQSTAQHAQHAQHTHSTRTARTAHAQHTHIPYRTLTARRAHAEHAQHSTVHIAQQNGTANSSRTRHHYASSL